MHPFAQLKNKCKREPHPVLTVARSSLLQGLAGKEQEKNDCGMILLIKRGGEEGKEEEWEGRESPSSQLPALPQMHEAALCSSH